MDDFRPSPAATTGGAPSRLLRLRRLFGRSGVVAGVAVLLLWGLDVSAIGLPETVERIACLLALALLLAWAAVALTARLGVSGWAGRAGWKARAAAAVLPLLFLAALAVRLIGVDHEVLGRYYLDEGTYYAHASAINDGQMLVHTFVYPHLLYYADAVILWVAARFPAAVAGAADHLFGVRDPLAVSWILLRALVAFLSALTTLPVFSLGERLGGKLAGALGAILLIVSALYNDGSHLNICDVPSAFFAAVCLAVVARLLERETTGDYLLAGIAAGLAAGTKYPAGVVAVAIVAVWLRHRIATRRFSFGLLWAGLAAIGALFAVMPSLAVYPKLAVVGQRGIFFGVRQYGKGGWIGVMPDSNWLFYAKQLLTSFGLPIAILGVTGLFLLPKERRRQMLWLLPYPIVFLALLISMNMVVKRNLYPVVPIAAALLGAGVAMWGERMPRLAHRFWSWPRRVSVPVCAALFLLCLWPAADAVARQEIGYVSRTTREEALDWIRQHVPPGVGIVKESYTPDFREGEYEVLQTRFAGRLSPAELREPQYDYLLLSSAAFARFLDPDALVKPHQKEIADHYQAILDTLKPMKEWAPGEMQLGPQLQLYRLDPDPATCLAGATLAAEDAFVPDGRMRPALPAGAPQGPEAKRSAVVQYVLPGQWSMLKGCFVPGSYRLTLRGEGKGEGEVRVVDQDGTPVSKLTLTMGTASAPRLFLAHPGKYLFYVSLPAGSRLNGVEIAGEGKGSPR